MRPKLLFLTGHLAYRRLTKILHQIEDADFDWEICDIGVKVAALMTESIIRRRLPAPLKVDRVIVPGRCRANLDSLQETFGCPFERGPEEVRDLPAYLGKSGCPPDLSRYELTIFAEIVEASQMSVEAILAHAQTLHSAGANVIDLGALPDTDFPHLEESIIALKEAQLKVSVDSANIEDLRRGGKAGADYLLSLTQSTLHLTDEVPSIPVLIPEKHGHLRSLYAAIEIMEARGKPYLADPVLDPIHFGFMASLERYGRLRRRYPEANILMGTGNLTELTDADSTGVTALLLGICSELSIGNVLVVQVSPHTRTTVEEHDIARRIMAAAKSDGALPRDYSDGLLCLRAKRPFPASALEIEENAGEVRDKNFRIEISEEGLHIYNRDGHYVSTDPQQLFPKLGIKKDGAHSFYLGTELARAEIAWQLGKHYAQDRPLNWGVAVHQEDEDLTVLKPAGETLKAAKKSKKR